MMTYSKDSLETEENHKYSVKLVGIQTDFEPLQSMLILRFSYQNLYAILNAHFHVNKCAPHIDHSMT
jgi:hypothetical protein